ncbi:hypothetical protein SEEH3193_14156, partial [Salmonella enterica subsp. enterica serovar Heidelberg str. RI-11-013193]
RQKGGGEAQKQEHHAAKQQNINQNPAQAAMQNFRYAFLITFGITIEGTVKPAEKIRVARAARLCAAVLITLRT